MRTNKQYVPRSIEFKLLSNKIANLNQKVAEMIHYWKIRCEEREAISTSYGILQLRLARMLSLEKSLKKSFNRYLVLHPSAREKKAKEPMYPLFATRKETQNLRIYFSKNFDSFKRAKEGSSFVALTPAEHSKLKRLLK